MTDRLAIRPLDRADVGVIVSAFEAADWARPPGQFERYLAEQAAGDRDVLVGRLDGESAAT